MMKITLLEEKLLSLEMKNIKHEEFINDLSLILIDEFDSPSANKIFNLLTKWRLHK